MNKLLRLLLFVAFGLLGCNNKQSNSKNEPLVNAKIEIKKINDFIKKYEEPSQIFKVLSDKSIKVEGKRGTIIFINPTDLTTESGQPLGKNTEVELKELINQEQLLSANAQTTSNGQLLVSGGAYFINITSDGQQLKLKEGKSLSVEFPKISDNGMSLFYGQRDSLGQLNWKQVGQKLESKPKQQVNILAQTDTSMYERHLTNRQIQEQEKNSELIENVYKAIEIKQFGWINCDKFYDIPNKTNLQFAFSDKDSIVSANVYLIFKDINSVMQSSYFSFPDEKFNYGFQNIPIGAKTQLIAFSIKNGKTYAYKTNLTIGDNKTIQLSLNEISQNQVRDLFQLN